MHVTHCPKINISCGMVGLKFHNTKKQHTHKISDLRQIVWEPPSRVREAMLRLSEGLQVISWYSGLNLANIYEKNGNSKIGFKIAVFGRQCSGSRSGLQADFVVFWAQTGMLLWENGSCIYMAVKNT